MSTSWPDELRTAWGMLREHPAQAREYRTRPLTGEFPLDAYAALRAADDAPCLLIRSEAPPGSLFEVGGMRLSVDRDERGTLLLLSLEDTARSDLFTTVCADALAAAGNDAEEALDLFLVRLDAWRRFLRERHAGLSREDTVGLIGELVMLERLLSSRPDFLASWKAPEDGLHDFEAGGHALEVKTGIGPASQLRISSLDQLETTGVRRLDLVHVRLVEDPSGRRLADLIEAIELLLPDEASRRLFANQILRRGLMPDDDVARTRTRVRLRSVEAYTVDDSFPRLLRSSVPTAIAEAMYALEVRALSDHSVDPDATFNLFTAGSAT
jgi:Putative  PD-(D/E)XK family member, (DUF4420)